MCTNGHDLNFKILDIINKVHIEVEGKKGTQETSTLFRTSNRQGFSHILCQSSLISPKLYIKREFQHAPIRVYKYVSSEIFSIYSDLLDGLIQSQI